MLILTRRPGESIRIGDDTTITVTSVRGLQVQIGIQAPKSVNIVREELLPPVAAQEPAADGASTIHLKRAKHALVHRGTRMNSSRSDAPPTGASRNGARRSDGSISKIGRASCRERVSSPV